MANPRNLVSADISGTHLQIVAETRFVATQRWKCDRISVAWWGRVYVDCLLELDIVGEAAPTEILFV
ncbi:MULTISPECIES: hypothetical protein [unclassified Microcoleus]|uniref:hypothetical protein n=1 Tax=unclassified Microcoleus TaxID=2642155 RepID=UPI002FD3DA42